MVNEERNETKIDESDSRLEDGRDFALVSTRMCASKAITIAREVVLNAMSETLVLVSTQAADLIDILHHGIVVKIHAYKTAKHIMTFTRSTFLHPNAAFRKVDPSLCKHKTVGEVANAPKTIEKIEDESL